MDIARELLHMMSPEQILKPADIVPGYCPETIFQLAASHKDLFNTCWGKVESDPRLTLSDTLDHCRRASICQFATAELAISMLGRGINLASTVKEYALTAWNGIALHHPDPEPLFNWLSRHECRPPPSQDGLDTPLIITARHDRVKETNWLLYHSCDERERWICAMEAATRQTDKSVYVLEIVMKRICLSVPAHHSEMGWVLKIAHNVVQGTCNHARECKLEGVDIVERRAIQKVGCINAFVEDSLLFPDSLLSDAREANLPNLADFLQIHNSETRRTMALV
ncbi:hypothetical protein PENSUB_6191 [Penicillium subrubescens]|uniref:Uncharacterized protein n=2 Tax=Penicillium subrubescens TaxID=1316194 RepID=A0A1Q5U2Y1_9EURO|nr:hypothetical protein PENSUB_6191 [Penicillium subrubescens]